MTHIEREITKTEYEQALEQGPYTLISQSTIMGYGAYGARVKEVDGHYYLSYSRGDSCD